MFKARQLTALLGDHNAWNLSSYIQCRKWLSKYYSLKNPMIEGAFEGVVYMADGRFKHGGIADRIKGMVSLYTYCRKHGLGYGIYFCHPFSLEDYLMPNEYDWRIEDKRLSFHLKQAFPLVVKPAHKDNHSYFETRMRKHCDKRRQVHAYCNSMYEPFTFSENFHRLFKPSPLIDRQLEKNREEIGGEYVSLSFRFMQLLGDFKDVYGKTLCEKEQEKLIEQCLAAIELVREKHPEVKKILLAADSMKFLQKAQALYPYTYVVPGAVAHIDHQGGEKEDPQVKTFVDFLMIANAQKAYFFARGDMYKASQFAVVAAMVGGIELESL